MFFRIFPPRENLDWLVGVSPLLTFAINTGGGQNRIHEFGATIFCIVFTAAECWAYWLLCKRAYRLRYNHGS